MIADLITASRAVMAAVMLFLAADSVPFGILYLLCGVSDILDGLAARTLRTAGERGARLDSAADLVFMTVYAVKILPVLRIPTFILIITAVIGAVKLTGILWVSKKKRALSVRHSYGNKLTGILIFLLPLSVRMIDVKYGAAIVCAAAAIATADELRSMRRTVNIDQELY